MDSLRKSVCRGLLEQTLQPIFLRTISAKDHLTLTETLKTIRTVIFIVAVLALWTCIGLGLLWVASAASLIAVPIIAVVFVLSLIFGRKE